MLAEILTEHGGFVRDGSQFQAPDRGDATIFASLGQQTSVIERIAAFRLESDYLMVTTRRGETYVILYEDVRSLRFAGREVGIRAPGH